MKFVRPSAALVVFSLAATAAGLTQEQRKLNQQSFEYAWSTIQKVMWNPMPAGLDWQKVHDEFAPKIQSARSMAEARAAMQDMIHRLKMTHFAIVPGGIYEHLDLSKSGDGATGFDLRILDGRATVVSVVPTSPAYTAGVRPGWQIVSARGVNLDDIIRDVSAALPETTSKPLLLNRAVSAELEGPANQKLPMEFLDGQGDRVKLSIQLTPPRGNASTFGFLPTQHVWFESRKIGQAGYIRFNLFLDPTYVSNRFAEAIKSYMRCDGIIIDLRGNPGGIGAMSMGMAGWFIDRPGVRLGVMKTKENTLNFVVFPRPETFHGRVAIIVDELTASTSEIFASGLKDLGRARIFGSVTAGAALPSVFEKLPNGDGFQYAIATYISEGGRPLEGIGVKPDVPVQLTREALLAGKDPALDAALAWIQEKGNSQ